VGPGDPSWTSALVALALSWPFDAGIPPGKSVGSSINGKPASVSFKSVNLLTVVTPSLTAGAQRITITNPDGEAIALEAALTAN